MHIRKTMSIIYRCTGRLQKKKKGLFGLTVKPLYTSKIFTYLETDADGNSPYYTLKVVDTKSAVDVIAYFISYKHVRMYRYRYFRVCRTDIKF